jgi:hypothetical protein
MTVEFARFRAWLFRTGWMVAFVAICGAVYLHAIRQKDRSYQALSKQLKDLEAQKIAISEEHQELVLQIQSESDPAWVEMCLKRNLGLVPEGQVKVYFQKE